MQSLLRNVFGKLSRQQDLTIDESRAVFERILSGALDHGTLGGLLGALAVKGECVDELVGAALAMRAGAVPIRCDAECVDTCGTGGDGKSTFNVSTTAAIIAAAAGATVAKHGNRSTTRTSGSSEVLAELGIDIEAPPAVVERCLREVRIGYLNARMLHPAMKHAAPVRQAIPVRTIFNLLGPLTNPAGARRQVLGVPARELVELMATALGKLGTLHSWVMHGSIEKVGAASASNSSERVGTFEGRTLGGLCELTVTGSTFVIEIRDGRLRPFTISPEDFGLKRRTLAEICVNGPVESAAVIREILAGKQGAAYDQAVLNAGATLLVAGKAADLQNGIAQARLAVDEGWARKTLADWRAIAGSK